MKGDLRCVEGRLFRHDPQYDDPDLETDVGQCPECDGDGCEPETRPRVIDNDRDEIIVRSHGKELRGWSYTNDAERRMKMLVAREYVEGWCAGRNSQ